MRRAYRTKVTMHWAPKPHRVGVVRRAVAWWLERAAERRSDEGHRIYRDAEADGRKLGGAASEIDMESRDAFNYELNVARSLRQAADYLRGRRPHRPWLRGKA